MRPSMRITTIEGAPLYKRFGIPLHVDRYQGGNFETHYHRFLELIVVNADRGRSIIAGHETEFCRGQVHRLGMFHPHRIEANAGERCDYFNVTFLPEAVSGSGIGVQGMLAPFYETGFRRPTMLPQSVYRRIVAICNALRSEIHDPDAQSAAIVLGEFRVLLGLVTRFAGQGAPTTDPRVQMSLRLISERFAEPLETREIAERVGTSAARLAQLFREHVGSTVRQTILRRRLTEAKRLLATTQMPVTAVLYDAGFNDASYFNRAFRKDTGSTPREFRLQAVSEADTATPAG